MSKPTSEMRMKQLNAQLPSSPTFRTKISKNKVRKKKVTATYTTEWFKCYSWPNCNMRTSKMAIDMHTQLSADSFRTFSIVQNHKKHSMD